MYKDVLNWDPAHRNRITPPMLGSVEFEDVMVRGRFISKVNAYPKVSINGRSRYFNGKLLAKHDWLEWSEKTNRI